MSYQEERLQEIADAIREVKGTTEKIPATNFASEIAGLSIVRPSGIITIKENGSHNVANYEWAEVSVEADLNERVIIGKWVCEVVGTGVTFNLEFKDDGNCISSVSHSGGDTIVELSYSTMGNQIYLSNESETMVAEYNNDNDTILLDFDGETAIFTRVQETANLITKEITENGTYTASDDGADGYSEVVVNVGGATPFADATPEEIQQIGNEISAKGMTSAEVEAVYGWKIGDTKDITLTTNEVIQVRIIGFNHDKATYGGIAGITLEMVNCLNTKYIMNYTATTAGGWGASQLRNTILPTIKSTLPQEWQDIIVRVDKKSGNGGGVNFTAVETTSDDLFILSKIELTNDSTGAGVSTSGASEEGVVYEYWKGKSQSDLTKTSNGTKSMWWTRTCFNIDSYHARFTDGTDSAPTANNTNVAVSFAFCVGLTVPSGYPISVSTDTEMTNALVEDNLGKVYKFTGTSDTFDNNAIYIIEEI